VVELGEHVTRVGEMNCAYRILVRNPQRKRPLGRARREWYSIKYTIKAEEGVKR
jgi:hypothetical protein